MSRITTTRNELDHRYEAHLDGATAVIEYRTRNDVTPSVIVMTHTEVPEEARGEGVASTLVRAALDDVRKRGEKVLPECPYVRSWIEDHEEYRDLVAVDMRRP